MGASGVPAAAALVRALKAGRISAAGLDVLPQEPLLRDEAEIFRGGQYSEAELRTLLASNVLLQFPNVLVTPNNAYNTRMRCAGSLRRRWPTSRRSPAARHRTSFPEPPIGLVFPAADLWLVSR